MQPSDLKDQLSTLPTKSEEPFSDREKTLTYLIIDTWEDIFFEQIQHISWNFLEWFYIFAYWHHCDMEWDVLISYPEWWDYNIVTDIELISFEKWYQQGRSYFFSLTKKI